MTSGVGEAEVSVQSAGDVGRCAVYREEGRKREEGREVRSEQREGKEMHYIRFLKSPKIVGEGNEKALVAKITIATDLGESFLAADVGVDVRVVGSDGESVLGPGKEYMWKGREGMRSLEVSLPMRRVRKVDVMRMCVGATGEAYTDTFESVLGLDSQSKKVENRGGVVTARSLEIDIRSGQNIGTGMAERVFKNERAEIHIWEETGESIARHVWYA